MFDNFRKKIKDYNKYSKVQSEVKKELEKIFATNEKNGIRIVIRGDKRIEKVEFDGEEQKELRDLINNTMKDIEKKVEKQMRGRLGDLGIPGA